MTWAWKVSHARSREEYGNAPNCRVTKLRAPSPARLKRFKARLREPGGTEGRRTASGSLFVDVADQMQRGVPLVHVDARDHGVVLFWLHVLLVVRDLVLVHVFQAHPCLCARRKRLREQKGSRREFVSCRLLMLKPSGGWPILMLDLTKSSVL